MVEQLIETDILQAIFAAMQDDDTEDTTVSSSSTDSSLESLIDSVDISETDTEIASDKEFKIDFSEIMDYSRLAEEFHFEQIHYGSIESDYLVSVAAEHEAKYKEWEEATEYLMEDSATMDEVEAQDTMQEVIYAAIFNTADVSFEKRKRLDTWIKFNQVEFGLYKANAAVRTEDVNYNVN